MNTPEKETRIVYDDPWYWIILWNKGKHQTKNYNTPKLRIDLSGLKQQVSNNEEEEVKSYNNIVPCNLRVEFENETCCTSLVDAKYVEALEKELVTLRNLLNGICV
jgi:hypothetical protein